MTFRAPDRHSVSRYLTPRVLARWTGRATFLAVAATTLGLAILPARVVVEARGTVQTSAGESDTSIVVVTAPFEGAIRSIERGSGENVSVGEVLAVMDTALVAELRASLAAELASAEAELLVARTRAAAEKANVRLEQARAVGRREVAGSEVTATLGMRDPLSADEYGHRRDAAAAWRDRTRGRLETITELHRLGAVSARAFADAEAEAARAEAELLATQSAFERAEAPLSDTLAAPRRHEAAMAAHVASLTRLSAISNVEAADAVTVAAEMRIEKVRVELERIESYLARSVMTAPRSGVVALTPGVEEGVTVARGQPIVAVAPSEKRVAVAEVPEWAFTAFEKDAEIVARPEATDRVVIQGRVLSRGFIVFERPGLLGPERFATARVEFDTAPIPLPPGSTVMMEATHARGPLLWVLMKMVTAPERAKFALGW